MGTSNITVNAPITSDLPSKGGMNLRTSGIAALLFASRESVAMQCGKSGAANMANSGSAA
jgi:hypothetical protein